MSISLTNKILVLKIVLLSIIGNESGNCEEKNTFSGAEHAGMTSLRNNSQSRNLHFYDADMRHISVIWSTVNFLTSRNLVVHDNVFLKSIHPSQCALVSAHIITHYVSTKEIQHPNKINFYVLKLEPNHLGQIFKG